MTTPKRLRVHVTAEHIAEARRRQDAPNCIRGYNCPIALAIRDLHPGYHVAVSGKIRIKCDSRTWEFYHTTRSRIFMRRADKRLPHKPITFLFKPDSTNNGNLP